jgi:hypothetical protein
MALVASRTNLGTDSTIHTWFSVALLLLELTRLASEAGLANASEVGPDAVDAAGIIFAYPELAHIDISIAQNAMEAKCTFAQKLTACFA